MKRHNQYEVTIKFESKSSGVNIYSGEVPYLGSLLYTDHVEIDQNEIRISGLRTSIFKLEEIFYNHNNSLYNQILKTLVYYYSLNFNAPSIERIIVTRRGQHKILEKKLLKSTQILQPILSEIPTKVSFYPTKIQTIFQETEKGKALLITLSYWLKALSTNDPIFTFERLWRGFNKLYSYIGQPGNENERHRNLRAFIIANPQILKFSIKEIKKYTGNTLRQSFRWRGMLLNDYSTQVKTDAFKDFILRYSDERVMRLFHELLPYREDFLKRENLLSDVSNHIATHLATPIKSDSELVSLLCIKYMYFVRNKSFHGEKIDGMFRLVENKETKEFEKLNKLLSSLIADLINSNDNY